MLEYISIDRMNVTCNVLGLIEDGDRFDEATMGKWKEYVDEVYLQKMIQGNHFAFYKEHEYVRQLVENSIC